jgi:predicted DCC family thiol-disulfide oxidoreductase YuxK
MKTDAKPIQSTQSLELFFDGACPLCLREVNLLKRLDRHRRIQFTDIASPEFRAPVGLDYTTLMARIHARRGQRWYEGVEVFRQLYTEVGFGALVALSRLPGIKGALNFAYRRFAQNRLKLTGRCDDTCAVGGAA